MISFPFFCHHLDSGVIYWWLGNSNAEPSPTSDFFYVLYCWGQSSTDNMIVLLIYCETWICFGEFILWRIWLLLLLPLMLDTWLIIMSGQTLFLHIIPFWSGWTFDLKILVFMFLFNFYFLISKVAEFYIWSEQINSLFTFGCWYVVMLA